MEGTITEELKAYIESLRRSGFTDEVIKQSLLGVGWEEAIVSEALAPRVMTAVVVAPQPVVETTPTSTPVTQPEIIATQPQVETTDNSVEVRQYPKRKKWLKIGVISFFVLVILLTVGWFILPLVAPERVVVAAINNLAQNDSTQYELTAEFQVTSPIGQSDAAPFSNFNSSFEASVDESKPSKGRIFVNFSSQGDLSQNPSGELGSFEARWLENTLYLRLDSTAKEISMFDLDEFIGKWFSVDIQKTLDDLGATEQYNFELTEDNTQELIDAYKKNQFLNVVASLGTQMIADQQTKGYQITYDKNKLASWLAEVEVITAQPNPRSVEEVKKEIPDPSEIGTMKIWISNKSKLPVRLEYELTATSDKIGVKAVVTLKNIGQPITVEKPDPVTPLDEMLKQLQNDFTGPSSQVTGAKRWLFSAYNSKNTKKD